MRRAQLHQLVTDLIKQTWNGDDADVAHAVLNDEAFDVLCRYLQEAGDIATVWAQLVGTLTDNDLDFLAEDAHNPAAFLASRTRDLPLDDFHTEQRDASNPWILP